MEKIASCKASRIALLTKYYLGDQTKYNTMNGNVASMVQMRNGYQVLV